MNSFSEQTRNRDHIGILGHSAILWNRIFECSRCGILFLVCVVSGISQAQDGTFIESIAKADDAVVPVACANWPGPQNNTDIKEIKGTGLFVSFEGDFITAAHVIAGNFQWDSKTGEPTGACFPVIYLPHPTWEKLRWFQFRECSIDTSLDVAVCRTVENPFGYEGVHPVRLHLVNLEPPKGTAVAFSGFPQMFPVPITSQGHIAGIGEFAKPFNDNRRYILVDKNNWHGVSGGPLYLSNGDVIGVMTKMGEGLWDGLGFAILSGPILTFLSAHHIPIWTSDETQHQSENNKQAPKKK
jgi:Trypsin-like peptidase domain